MSKTVGGILAALLVALALGAGWRWWSETGTVPPAVPVGGDATPPETDRVDAAGTSAPAGVGTGADTATTPVPPAPPPPSAALAALPLPPVDAPVTQVFDELLDRARRGDHRAACRLAADLQRCRRLADLPGLASQLERRAAATGDDARREAMIDTIARIEDVNASQGAACDGVSREQLDHAFALQVQAAQARPELRVWAAVNPALDSAFFVDQLDQWAQYRQLALPWLHSAAAEGDVAALIALARIHGDERRPGPRNPPFRRIDDAEAVLYASLLERYGVQIAPVQRDAELRRGRLDADALAAIEARADALFRPERARELDRESQAHAMRRSFDLVPPATECE